MQAIVCEMCGNNDIVKEDGLYVCRYCGTKYSVEEARKLLIEVKVDVSGSKVKVDESEKLENLFVLARRAFETKDYDNAAKYYEMILFNNAYSWEAAFYFAYSRAVDFNFTDLIPETEPLRNCIDHVLQLISEKLSTVPEKNAALGEVISRCSDFADEVVNVTLGHYTSRNNDPALYRQMYLNCDAAARMMYQLGDSTEKLFDKEPKLSANAASAWKKGIALQKAFYKHAAKKDELRNDISEYSERIRRFEPDYGLTKKSKEKKRCYVATAVYGSYDCPEVWTLRRYRGSVLEKTLFGRAFVRVYYALSPTAVRLFSNKKRVLRFVRKRLDSFVGKLNERGFENTPYND
ncbi:MAG: TFIIB-type zinc finger domain-containing protein [Clostridia bacterium]|nr:TFIIB-type zinc finger domain-containing protein [Clostridia bacterium]